MPANLKSGFTLVEILIIAPIVILLVGVFIGLVVNLTGESLVIKERNDAVYDLHETIDEIERSVSQATGFLSTTGDVTPPQGRLDDINSNVGFCNKNPCPPAPSTEPDTLIMRAAATTAGPLTDSRALIYTGAGACNYKNPLYQYTVVYFVKNNTLYKRTIIVPTAACASPWQRNSCSEANTAAYPSTCKAEDEKLLENVSGFAIQYYTSSSSADTSFLDPALATQASSVKVTISQSRQSAGSAVAQSTGLRVTSLNAQAAAADNSQPPVATPDITYAWTDANDPYKTTFSWQAIGNASGYNIRYRLCPATPASCAAVSWVNGPQNTSALSYDVTGTYRKQNIEFELTAVSSSGNFLYGTATATITRWNTCTYSASVSGQTPWQSYGAPFTAAGFTKTSSGLVGLRGLVRSGTIGDVQHVCRLPVGFRPTERVMFQAVSGSLSSESQPARIDITTDGYVLVEVGNNAYVSLDGIIFDTSSSGWTTGSYASGSTNYGSPYALLKYKLDSAGRAHVQALAKPTVGSTYTNGALIATMPVGYRPSHIMHMPSNSYLVGALSFYNTGTINARTTGSIYWSLQWMYYPSAFNSWNSLNLALGNWINYDTASFPPAQCYKGTDDVVVIRGLIKNGTNGATLGNTSSSGCGIHADGQLLLSGWKADEADARFDLQANGNLVMFRGHSSWTSIDHVHFIAD